MTMAVNASNPANLLIGESLLEQADHILDTFVTSLEKNDINQIEKAVTSALEFSRKHERIKHHIELNISLGLIRACSKFPRDNDFTHAKTCAEMIPLREYRDRALMNIIAERIIEEDIKGASETAELITEDNVKSVAFQKVIDGYLYIKKTNKAFLFAYGKIENEDTKDMAYLKIVRAYANDAPHDEDGIDRGLKIARRISDTIVKELAFLAIVEGALKIGDVEKAKKIASFITNVDTRMVAQVKINNAVTGKKVSSKLIREVRV